MFVVDEPGVLGQMVRFLLLNNPVHCSCNKVINEFCGSLQGFKVHVQVSGLIVLFDPCVQSLPNHFISLCADFQMSPSATDESSRASTASTDSGGSVRQVAENCCVVKWQWLVAPAPHWNWVSWVQHTKSLAFISLEGSMCNFQLVWLCWFPWFCWWCW